MANTDHKRFTGYPCLFDALTIADILSVSPSAAVQKMVLTPDGSVQPAVAAAVSQDPRVSLTAMNLAAILTAVPLRSCLHIGTLAKIQFQARQTGGTFQSGSNHVTLTSTIGDLYVESIRAQQDEQNGAQLSLQYVPLFDGTNPPLACNVGQSLTGAPSFAAVYKLGPTIVDTVQLKGVQSAQYSTGINYSTKRGDGEIYARIGSISALAETLEIGFDNLELVNTIGFGSKPIVSGVTQYFRKVGVAPNVAEHVSITINAGLIEVTDMSQSGNEDAGPRLMITAARDNAAAVSVNLATTVPF